MEVFVVLLILCQLVTHGDTSRCFECNSIPTPHACSKLTTCSSDESCSTEMIVTATGNIEYNTGCLPKTSCSAIGGQVVGRRSLNITQRSSSSITACIECCVGDFCNNQGCGSQAVPLGQRGLYCFNCDYHLNPQSCNNVAVCDATEQCLLFSPAEFGGLPETVYRSQCQNKASCSVLSQTLSNQRCAPTCCDTDFCNNQCGLSSNSMTTSPPHTTPIYIPTHQATTQTPAVLTTMGATQGSCKQGHYFDDITGMCIFIDETRTLSYADAKRACEDIGDELVTIDTHEKTVFVENMIIHHTKFPTETGRTYYIGLTDKHDNSVFYWANGHKIYYTNWGGGDEVAPNQQPDDSAKNPQNCVILYGPDHYRWHDDRCSNKWHYICEDPSGLNHNNNHQIDQQTTIPPPTHHSNTFHCDAHGGYMLVKSAHEHMCVHIVKNHANWDHAQATCKKEGGDLVVLDNSEKAHLIRDMVNRHTYTGEQGYWIGAKDFSSTDKFSWVNGQPVTYGDWHPGQPNHHDGGHDQNCACLWSSGEHFQWHDDYCPKALGYICERR